MKQNNLNPENKQNSLFSELSKLIEQSRRQVINAANSTLITLYWQVGKRINDHVLQKKRAGYGKEIVSTVSTQLKEKYGKSFEERNLRRMMQFAEQFTELKTVADLAQHLSWSHFVELLPLKSMDAKLFYAKVSSLQGLGIRELRKKIATKTFERTEISNLQIAQKSSIPINTFK